MTITETILLISATSTLVTSVGGLAVSLRNSRKIDNTNLKVQGVDSKVETVTIKVDETHKAANSMKDQLVALTRKDAHREGVQAGIELASTVQP